MLIFVESDSYPSTKILDMFGIMGTAGENSRAGGSCHLPQQLFYSNGASFTQSLNNVGYRGYTVRAHRALQSERPGLEK